VRLLNAETCVRFCLCEAAALDDAVDLQSEMGLELRSGLAKPISANTLPLIFSKVMRLRSLVAIVVSNRFRSSGRTLNKSG
jgi:hypothetical protein